MIYSCVGKKRTIRNQVPFAGTCCFLAVDVSHHLKFLCEEIKRMYIKDFIKNLVYCPLNTKHIKSFELKSRLKKQSEPLG